MRSPLDNWISNGNTNIHKRSTKPGQIRLHSKRPHTITKINDNINLERTKAGSENAHSRTTCSKGIIYWLKAITLRTNNIITDTSDRFLRTNNIITDTSDRFLSRDKQYHN